MLYDYNHIKIEGNDNSFLGNEFTIHEQVRNLPLTAYPSYIHYSIIGFCLRGSAELNVHACKHLWVANELIVILPGMLASVRKRSADFLANYFVISNSLHHDVLSGICRFSIDFYFYMRSHYFYPLKGEAIKRFEYFYELICYRTAPPGSWYPRLAVVSLLRILYLDIYSDFKSNSAQISLQEDSRKMELTRQFFLLIMEHYKKKREVSFYADKLHLSPKYLTMVVKEVSGKSVRDWITEYTLLEIKALLMDSALTIQEIVNCTNFVNQSSLSRFFRKHTGMSPKAYRTLK